MRISFRGLAFLTFIVSIFYLHTLTIFAANPGVPISPDDNIQDPGALSTPWGGCGPADSNCYVTVSGGGANIYTDDGTLTDDRLVALGNNVLTIRNNTRDYLVLDPTTGSERSFIQAYNNFGDQGYASLELLTTNADSTSIFKAQNADSASITAFANTSNLSSLDYSADTHTFTGDIILSDLAGNGDGFLAVDNDGVLSWAAGGGGDTIYTADSTLTGDRVVSLGGNTISINDSGSTYLSINPDPLNQVVSLTSIDSSGDSDIARLRLDVINNVSSTATLSSNFSEGFSLSSIELFNNISTSSITYTAGSHTFNGSAVFNESGVDKDFRIEGDNDANLFFVDASTDKIGIGDGTPDYLLDIEKSSVDTDIFALTDSDGSCLHNPEAGSEVVNCSSDERLKTNIVDTDSALEYFSGLVIRDYNVIASGNRMTGVIAQEVLETHPELVSMGPNDMYSVELPNQWKIVKAIQELDLKIDGITNFEEIGGNSFVSKLRLWFADTGNSINEFVVGILRAKDQICINNTCINEAQLQEIIQKNTNIPNPVSPPITDLVPGPQSVREELLPDSDGDDVDVEVIADPLPEPDLEIVTP
jgi:hypothetical protein